MTEKTCDFCGGTFTDGVACYVLEQAAECNRAPTAKQTLLRRRLADPSAEPEEDDRFARELREAYATGEAMSFARVLSGRLRQMDKRAKAANIRADNAERQCRLAKDMLTMERAARKELEGRPVP